MRPSGEVRQALLGAVAELATPDRAPTLIELATRSQVDVDAALFTVKNMVRSGALVIVRTRRVPYRNRPVAEYAKASPTTCARSAFQWQIVSCWSSRATV